MAFNNSDYRLACRVIVEPTTGTAACGVSATILAGICPAACIALYCNGVMCSKPGGGTSQYNEILRRRERCLPLPPPLPGERERLRLPRERDRLPRLRDLSRDLCRRVLPRSPTPPRSSRSWKKKKWEKKKVWIHEKKSQFCFHVNEWFVWTLFTVAKVK